MKLRIKNNGLRLRVSSAEAVTLALVGRVEDALKLGPETCLAYELCLLTDIDQPAVCFDGGQLSVRFPTSWAEAWLAGEADSLRAELSTGEAEPLQLKIEREGAPKDKYKEREQVGVETEAEDIIELSRSPFFESSDRYDVDEDREAFVSGRWEISD